MNTDSKWLVKNQKVQDAIINVRIYLLTSDISVLAVWTAGCVLGHVKIMKFCGVQT